MRTVLGILLLLAALPAWADEEPSQRLGVSAGVPHTLALTYEQRVTGPLHLQGSVGTIIVYSSACARALVATSGRLQPYAFVGGGTLYALGTDTGEAEGWTGYGWWGLGLRLRLGRLFLWGEWSHLDGLSTSKGYDSTVDGPAAGLLWAF